MNHLKTNDNSNTKINCDERSKTNSSSGEKHEERNRQDHEPYLLNIKKMFVGGLRAGINENNLREYFSKFGKITEVIMIKHRDGKPRGFGLVIFEKADAIEEVLAVKLHMINDKKLIIKKAVPQTKKQPRPPPSFQLQQQQQSTTNDIQNNRRPFRNNSKNHGGVVRARRSGGAFLSNNRWTPYPRGKNGGGGGSQPNFNFFFGC